MDDRMITTFSTNTDFEAAVSELDRRGLAYELLLPPARTDWLAAPGLIVSVDVRASLSTALGDALRSSGWVDYRQAAGPVSPAPDDRHPQDVFGHAAVTLLTPCVADETKIRIIAEITGDLEPVFPYLNALMPHGSYSPEAQTLSYLDGHRMVVLYPQRIAMAKPDELVDAWLRLDDVRRLANDAWARRDEIEPDYTTRRKPPALEILKRLPQTNCGQCGEMTCMAFALRLWAGEARLRACTPVLIPDHAAQLEALREICAGLGVSTI
jgi:ArsR family metal-binding transcriptional regulator